MENNFNLQTIVVDANFGEIGITDNFVVMLVNNRSWDAVGIDSSET